MKQVIESMAVVDDAISELGTIKSFLPFSDKLKSLDAKWFRIKAASARRTHSVVLVMPTEFLLKHLATLQAFGGGNDDGIKRTASALNTLE